GFSMTLYERDAHWTLDARRTDAPAGALPESLLALPVTFEPAPPQAGELTGKPVFVPVAAGIWSADQEDVDSRSLVVEFADHLMLIEAPQNDMRALAVIAKARELRPDKPLTQLVNSHHHFDHSGGIRAAISEGLTIITHQGNAALFEEMAKRPHTVVPDALAKNAKPVKIETVGDEKVVTDGTMTVNLYPVSGEHSETMIVAYFPRERLLVEADVYTPGGAVQMFAGRFLEELKKRNLRIDRIVPLHGKVVPYAQFVKEATSPSPTS
ncbi:MAG: MBL fold metallo-hydrolase, partial [Acidobacteria bacterium]